MSEFGIYHELLDQYLTSLMSGAWVTVKLTVYGVSLGMLLGFIFGTIRAASNGAFKFRRHHLTVGVFLPIVYHIIGLFLWIVRGTPILVQFFYVYFSVPAFFGVHLSPFEAGVLALIVNSSCYITETVRGAILSVSKGLYEAGQAMGLPPWKIYLRIVGPVAFRRMVPSLGNQIIISLKDTSVFVALGVAELLFTAKQAIAETYRSVELYTIVAVMYLIMVTVIDKGLKLIEKRMRIL